MTGKKAFFITFVTTLSFMLAAFRGLYLLLGRKTTRAGTDQPGVAIAPGVHDTRNLLVCAGDDQCRFFFLIRLNAPQNKISIVAVSPSYVYEKTGRSLSQSMEKAGILQCIMDTKEEFGIEIDNYLYCHWDEMRTILQDFDDFALDYLGENLPRSIKSLLLKNAEMLDADSLINAVEKGRKFLDNELGLGFLNECTWLLMYANGENLHNYAGERLKQCYSRLETNLNTRALKDYQRIIRFLSPATTQYIRRVITPADTRAGEKITRAFLE